MSSLLHLSTGLTLPTDAVTERFAFMGRTGSGKTYGATKLAEEMLLVGAQVVVLDPAGKWYGLRLAGTDAGFPIPVFGGKHGDVPLDPSAGAFFARLIIERGISAVLDASQFRKNDFRRFVTAFCEELFHLQKGLDDPAPMHVFLEEAHLVAPQKADAADVPRMLGAVTDLMREGRNHGIGMSVLDQRPATVNKDVLTQAECLLAFQTTSSQDRKAIKEWIDEHESEGGDLLSEIKSFNEGECFFYSPGWLKTFRKIKISRKRTADVSKTPKLGVKRAHTKPLTPVDLDSIRSAMQEVIASVEANDPKALRARIRELEKQLAAAPKENATRVEVSVVKPEDLKRLERAVEKLDDIRDATAQAQQTVSLEAHRLSEQLQKVLVAQRVPPTPALARRTPAPAPAPARRDAPPAPPPDGIGGGALKMLHILVQLNTVGVARRRLAVLSGFSPSSGTYGTYLSQLNTNALLEKRGDMFHATDAGVHSVGRPSPLPTGPELLEMWCSKFTGKTRDMLRALVAQPGGLSRNELAAAVELEPTSGTYGTYLSQLNTNALIEKRNGLFVAVDDFFN